MQQHGLMGLNQLLVAGNAGGKVAAAAVVGAIAACPQFQAHALAEGPARQPDAAARLAGGACARRRRRWVRQSLSPCLPVTPAAQL